MPYHSTSIALITIRETKEYYAIYTTYEKVAIIHTLFTNWKNKAKQAMKRQQFIRIRLKRAALLQIHAVAFITGLFNS